MAKPATPAAKAKPATKRAKVTPVSATDPKPAAKKPAARKPAATAKKRVHRRPRRPHGLTVKQVVNALRNCGGIRAHAAAALLVDRSAITRFIQLHPEVVEVEREIVEELADTAESQLLAGINRGEFPFIKLFLESKARDRGYGRNVALTGPNGGPIEIRDLSNLTDEQLEALERAAAALASGTGGAEG
jgi:hypothetical protein